MMCRSWMRVCCEYKEGAHRIIANVLPVVRAFRAADAVFPLEFSKGYSGVCVLCVCVLCVSWMCMCLETRCCA